MSVQHSIREDTIFDLGMADGEDTRFYLSKGFSVISIEANPFIVERNMSEFHDHLVSGQLKILDIGIWDREGSFPFYRNLENDHWSSFDRAYGCRQESRCEILQVKCWTIDRLCRLFGVPYYMKIDIEGADRRVLAGLAGLSARPPFISVEEFGAGAVDLLSTLGYDRFKIMPQRDKRWSIPPHPPREGRFVQPSFSGKSSGLFGRELPGEWMDTAECRDYLIRNIRDEKQVYIGPALEWFDIHATTARVLQQAGMVPS